MLDGMMTESAESGEMTENDGQPCIPSALLSIDGTAPADGDEVEFTATGRVTRSEGGNSYVKLLTVNGEPVPDHEASESPEVEATEENARGDAEKMDRMRGLI